MVKLDLLHNVLKIAKIPTDSDTKSEEHFDDIATLVEQENMEEAAKLIEKNFSKGISDIRLIAYYLYAHFTHYGIKSFSTTLPCITSIVNEHWEILTPVQKRDNHFQNSFNWLFSHLLNKMKYCEKQHKSGKTHPVWEKSIQQISLEEFEHLLTTMRDFQHFYAEKWPKSPGKDRILHLVKKVEEWKPLILAEIEANTPQIIQEEPEIKNVVEEVQTTEEPTESFHEENFEEVLEEPFHEPENVIEEFQESSSESTEASPAMETKQEFTEELLFANTLQALTQKLQLFESLIAKNDYLKAAIIARDIDLILENFDPVNYFPKLLAKYFSLFAKHVAALSEQYEKKESLQIQKLEKLYQADLDMFMEW